MMIDLNQIKEESVKIFNEGLAGKAKNVSLSVIPKDMAEPDNYPDYNIIFTDVKGNILKEGFYVNVNGTSPEEIKNKENTLLSRLIQIARSVLGKDYVFPDMGSSIKEIVPNLFKLIKQNESGNKVNIFITYGTKTRPGNFLKLRYFGPFIESADTPDSESLLIVKPGDLIERVIHVDVKKETEAAKNFFNL